MTEVQSVSLKHATTHHPSRRVAKEVATMPKQQEYSERAETQTLCVWVNKLQCSLLCNIVDKAAEHGLWRPYKWKLSRFKFHGFSYCRLVSEMTVNRICATVWCFVWVYLQVGMLVYLFWFRHACISEEYFVFMIFLLSLWICYRLNSRFVSFRRYDDECLKKKDTSSEASNPFFGYK